MSKVHFADLCEREPQKGYALDFRFLEIGRRRSIKNATKRVYEKINECIKKIEDGTGRYIKKFSIRKTYIREKRVTFKLYDDITWEHDLNARWEHPPKGEEWDGLVVVAAVDERAIPRDCEDDGYIIDAEEYALLLKTRVTQMFLEEDKFAIKDASKPGNKDEGRSAGYILYMTYEFITEELEVDFADLKHGRKKGYAFEFEKIGKEKTITKATDKVHKKIKKCIEDIKSGTGRSITFRIRKNLHS